MRRGLLSLCLLSLMSACLGDLFPGGVQPSPGAPAEERLPDGGTRPAIEVVIAPAQIRLLSAPEYRNTVRDLLGLSASTTLTHADWTGGFDNGVAIKVDDNLLSALLTEAESLSAQYVATRLRADFACFDPADVTDGCVQTVIAQLGRRAHRRALSSSQRDELFTFFQTISTGSGSRVMGMELLVARLLSAPQFLYRTEVGRPTQAGSLRFALDDLEKASLVAYTLTGTMPDEPLLADAEAGQLDVAVNDLPFQGEVKAFAGPKELIGALAASPTTAACFSKNFLKFALGSPAAPYTETLSDSLVQKLGDDPLNVAELVEEALASPHLYARLGWRRRWAGRRMPARVAGPTQGRQSPPCC